MKTSTYKYTAIWAILIVIVFSAVMNACRTTNGASFEKIGGQITKPRLIVTTDIGGDPDDMQSLIRLLLYANEFDIEGIIVSASGTIGELGQEIIQPKYVHQVIDSFALVRPQLIRHDKDYPTVQRLRTVVKYGNPTRGWESIGKGKSTEASDWIRKCIDKDDPRPLNIAIWGGQTDFAQAMWEIKSRMGESGLKVAAQKLRVYDIADQDKIFDKIITEFPGLFYVLSDNPTDKYASSFRGMFYKGDLTTVSYDWVSMNIKNNHGPMCSLYPMTTSTRREFPYNCMKEGDTPSWYFFYNNGLNIPSSPRLGSWGGRYEYNGTYYQETSDNVDSLYSARATVLRWRNAYNNDFAARADWCVKPFHKANHSPQPVLNGVGGKEMLRFKVRPGDEITLDASESADPDENEIHFNWWLYKDISGKELEIENSSKAKTKVRVSSEAKKGNEYHVILEIVDYGIPSLSAYRRVCVEVI